MKQKDNKKYLIIGLCAIVVLMAVGYAAFAQMLQINGTSQITSNWCVGFDNTKTDTMTKTAGISGGTEPTGTITYGGGSCGTKSETSVDLSATFKQPGDSIEYTLTILNEGSLNAVIDEIKVGDSTITSDTTFTRGNVKFQIKMPASLNVAAGSSTTMKVVATFQNDTDITQSYSGEHQEISVSINASQDTGNGGVTPSQQGYTGTIYRHSSTDASIGDSIVPVSGTKWCDIETASGDQYDCFDTETECNTFLSDNDYTETDTCQQKTVTSSGGIGEYKTEAEVPTYSDRTTVFGKQYYLKHDVVDNIITASYVCFITDTEHCLRGGDGGAAYTDNVSELSSQQSWFTGHSGSCTLDPSGADSYCNGGPFHYVKAYSDGEVKVNDNERCIVYVSGHSTCDDIGSDDVPLDPIPGVDDGPAQ